MTNTEPKFNVGDLVRHRASGKLVIVTGQNYRCIEPAHVTRFGHVISPRPLRPLCKPGFAGTYNVSVDFGDELEFVSELLLETIEEDTP